MKKIPDIGNFREEKNKSLRTLCQEHPEPTTATCGDLVGDEVRQMPETLCFSGHLAIEKLERTMGYEEFNID